MANPSYQCGDTCQRYASQSQKTSWQKFPTNKFYFDKHIFGSHYQATLLWHGFSQVNLLQSRRPHPLIITLIMTLIITLIPSSPYCLNQNTTSLALCTVQFHQRICVPKFWRGKTVSFHLCVCLSLVCFGVLDLKVF